MSPSKKSNPSKSLAKRRPDSPIWDWDHLKGRIDLASVAAALLGPAPGRRGAPGGGRRWWCCPFHRDRNPSFCVALAPRLRGGTSEGARRHSRGTIR